MAKKTTSLVEKAASTTKGALKTVGSTVTKNPTTALYIGVGIASLVGIYFLYDALKKVTDGVGSDPDAGGGNVDPGNAGDKPFGATITQAQAQTGAATLLSAMDSVGQLSTSEFNMVKNVLRHRNATDFAMYSEAFGNPSRSPITGEESPWFMGEALNLSQWLSIETKDWQKTQLKQIMPTVF